MTSHEPNHDRVLLETVMENAGVEVRVERCETGGLVRMAGRTVLFVPLGCSEAQCIDLYVETLKKIDTARLRLPPRVRQLLGEKDWNE